MSPSVSSGIVALNSTLSFELQPQDKQETGSEREETGSGEEPGSDVHLLFSLEPPKGDSAAGCGVKHTAIPHIHSRIHLERVRPGLGRVGPVLDYVKPGLDQVRTGLDQVRPGLVQVRLGQGWVRPGLDHIRAGLDRIRPGLDRV